MRRSRRHPSTPFALVLDFGSMARSNGWYSPPPIVAAGLAGTATVMIQWLAEHDAGRDFMYAEMARSLQFLAVFIAITVAFPFPRPASKATDVLSVATIALLRALVGYKGLLAGTPRLAVPTGAVIIVVESLAFFWLSLT